MSVFGVFLVCIFSHLDWIQRDTSYLSIFSPNARKYGLEELRTWTSFTKWFIDTVKKLPNFDTFPKKNLKKLTGAKFKQTELLQTIGKNVFPWSSPDVNWKNKRYQKHEYCCFVLHKLWTYFNQVSNFKKTRKYPQIYMLQIFNLHIFSQFNPF